MCVRTEYSPPRPIEKSTQQNRTLELVPNKFEIFIHFKNNINTHSGTFGCKCAAQAPSCKKGGVEQRRRGPWVTLSAAAASY